MTKSEYSWYSSLSPDQFSKAYKSLQKIVQENKEKKKKRKSHNRKWMKWRAKLLYLHAISPNDCFANLYSCQFYWNL